MRSSVLSAGIVVIALMAVIRPADGQPTPGRGGDERFREGMRLYREGDYRASAAALAAAHALKPGREVLFAWAQAARLSGDCATAAPLYRRVLDDDPPAEQGDAVRQVLTLCEATLAAATPPEPMPEEPPAIERGPRVPPPWYTDIVGGSLMASAALAGSAGAYFVVTSIATHEAAPDAATHADALALDRRAQRERIAGVVGIGVGAALLVAGVVRYATRSRRSAPMVSAWATADAAGGAIRFGF